MLFPWTRIKQSLFTIIIENIGFTDNTVLLLQSGTHYNAFEAIQFTGIFSLSAACK